MKNQLWMRLVGAVAVSIIAATTIAGCSATRSSESTGEYVDSAAITSKVKTALLNDSGLKSFQIGVETFKDDVQLSGFVSSDQIKAHAGAVAASVPGVISVRNNLIVR